MDIDKYNQLAGMTPEQMEAYHKAFYQQEPTTPTLKQKLESFTDAELNAMGIKVNYESKTQGRKRTGSNYTAPKKKRRK